MNKKEIAQLVGWAAAPFPSIQKADLAPLAESWYMMLQDIDFNLATVALQKVLTTAKFFPTIAEIREAVAELTNPNEPTAIEAWGLVVQAIRNYGFYREGEALESLPPDIAKVVRCIGWRELCTCEEPDVIRGQFRKAYEQQASRQKELAVLPENVRQLLTGASTKLLS